MKTFQTILALVTSASAVSCATLRSRQDVQLPTYHLIPLDNSTIKSCAEAYPVNEIDSCDSVARMWRLNTAQFLTYNPVLELDCSNLNIGQQYCVLVREEPAVLRKPREAKTKAAPGPTMGTTVGCDQWQKIFPNDKCEDVAKNWRVSKGNLVKWNPELGADCTNMKVNSYICVRVPTSTH